MQESNKLEKIISLCKRRGFVFPGSEIYGGLAGTWDYGPLGLMLKNNIKNSWWKRFVEERDDMYGVDAAILMNSHVWEVTGHISGFHDPLVECKKCHKRFRADHLSGDKCPDCGGELTEEKHFNMMFKTNAGPVDDTASKVYLRPETAQGMFVNFKNIIDSFHPKLPFGMAQIGKAFRNEITPKDFTFRSREFEQMEIEYFIKPPKKEEEWQKEFENWRKEVKNWIVELGIAEKSMHELDVPQNKLAHYSKKTVDFEYDFPFGRNELCGLAYRTDFDLKNHKLDYYDEETKERFMPHVIEPSFGLDRLVLALLAEAYNEDELGGEKRVYLKLKPSLAPVKVAVFPLLKNKLELVEKAKKVWRTIQSTTDGLVMFDDNGNIGKRYRRQDEIGTPFCVTIDFDTLENDTVTVRDRDTGKQERVKVGELASLIKKNINK
ncbi:MAG: Glycine-tRNA ligase [Parcubacteria group bacterium GW2011_GWB1_43_8]|nr:MAG: Glycine-tRNA ligase [Parcubacteria group bacterium GW2011_GWB1_43_8]